MTAGIYFPHGNGGKGQVYVWCYQDYQRRQDQDITASFDALTLTPHSTKNHSRASSSNGSAAAYTDHVPVDLSFVFEDGESPLRSTTQEYQQSRHQSHHPSSLQTHDQNYFTHFNSKTNRSVPSPPLSFLPPTSSSYSSTPSTVDNRFLLSLNDITQRIPMLNPHIPRSVICKFVWFLLPQHHLPLHLLVIENSQRYRYWGVDINGYMYLKQLFNDHVQNGTFPEIRTGIMQDPIDRYSSNSFYFHVSTELISSHDQFIHYSNSLTSYNCNNESPTKVSDIFKYNT